MKNKIVDICFSKMLDFFNLLRADKPLTELITKYTSIFNFISSLTYGLLPLIELITSEMD